MVCLLPSHTEDNRLVVFCGPLDVYLRLNIFPVYLCPSESYKYLFLIVPYIELVFQILLPVSNFDRHFCDINYLSHTFI
jgi:hypothetical protein